MTVLYVLVPLALLLAALAVAAFRWAANDDQFEDLDSPPIRILSDDEVDGGRALTQTLRREGGVR